MPNASSYRLSNRQQRGVVTVELDHHGVAQRAVWNAIAEDDPSRPRRPLPPPCPCHVNRLVGGESGAVARSQDGHRALRGVIAEDPVATTGRILDVAQGEKQSGADEDPQRVEQPETPPHARYDNGP